MAPSTATPSNLHRGPIACLKCRAAKVRCLVSQSSDRCHRCIANDSECVFHQKKRVRARARPYLRETRGGATPRQQPSRRSLQHEDDEDDVRDERGDTPAFVPITPTSHDLVPSNPGHHVRHGLSPQPPHQGLLKQPLITPEIRARIVSTLATLKGKRGAPFSFITSGEEPHQSRRAAGTQQSVSSQHLSGQQAPANTEPSMNLSTLLRPLAPSQRAQVIDGSAPKPTSYTKMPTYIASMSLGQTVNDPIDAGMLSVQVSRALFDHFMYEMNVKWEYVLDPRIDTHDNVRARSRLLFATILFCSSKFTIHAGTEIISTPDPYLQTRLCSLARSLAVSTFAQGDRSIETMQAFYLLACWKDPEDDVSYLHSGYAFRIMQDLDLKRNDGDKKEAARRQRTWLALFRQDKQQSLFFVRRSYISSGDEPPSFLLESDTWPQSPHALPFDIAGCCAADIRRIQSKLHVLVRRSSSAIQPCLLEAMDADLGRWRTKWQDTFQRQAKEHENEQPSSSSSRHRLLHIEKPHWDALVGLWEHSVRLNIASMVLRQVLTTSTTTTSRSANDSAPSSDRLDLPGIGEVSSPNAPGLRESVEGAFGTLQSLIAFPPGDLRKASDSVLLLGFNAALFLCLLLVFPCDGILGVNFQKTAIGLIKDVARHMGECIVSPQDTVNLHHTYLESLVDLVSPANSGLPLSHSLQPGVYAQHPDFDQAELQAAQDLAGMAGPGGIVNEEGNEEDFGFSQSQAFPFEPRTPDLANLLDTYFSWDM